MADVAGFWGSQMHPQFIHIFNTLKHIYNHNKSISILNFSNKEANAWYSPLHKSVQITKTHLLAEGRCFARQIFVLISFKSDSAIRLESFGKSLVLFFYLAVVLSLSVSHRSPNKKTWNFQLALSYSTSVRSQTLWNDTRIQSVKQKFSDTSCMYAFLAPESPLTVDRHAWIEGASSGAMMDMQPKPQGRRRKKTTWVAPFEFFVSHPILLTLPSVVKSRVTGNQRRKETRNYSMMVR
jgi:hypothetical protein